MGCTVSHLRFKQKHRGLSSLFPDPRTNSESALSPVQTSSPVLQCPRSEQHTLGQSQQQNNLPSEQTILAMSFHTEDPSDPSTWAWPRGSIIDVDANGYWVVTGASVRPGLELAMVSTLPEITGERDHIIYQPSPAHSSHHPPQSAANLTSLTDPTSSTSSSQRWTSLPPPRPVEPSVFSAWMQRQPPPPPRSPSPLLPIHEAPHEPPSPQHTVTCTICTSAFTPSSATTNLTRPCRRCSSTYCGACLRSMFIGACHDASRMPPRCCVVLQLHVALPFLSDSEAAEYRAKFEEWSTPDRTYCPVPTCSAFISRRLIDAAISSSPSASASANTLAGAAPDATHPHPTLPCPACAFPLCLSCKQPAHPDTPVCPSTADLDPPLAKWGYKRCPKCRHGVRRMYGCSHMQCVCGAHWCWHCVRPLDACDRATCVEAESEENGEFPDEEEGEGWVDDDWSTVEERGEELGEEREASPGGPPGTASRRDSSASSSRAGRHPTRPDSPHPGASPRHAVRLPSRRANLDAGPQYYWEGQGLDFGEEPDEQNQDHAWYCEHRFRVARVAAEPAERSGMLRTSGSGEMECNRCWEKCVAKPARPGKRGSGRAGARGDGDEESDEEEMVKERGRRPGSGASGKLPLVVDRNGDVAMMDGGDTAGSSAPRQVATLAGSRATPGLAWECKRCGIVVCDACKMQAGSGAAKAR